MYLTQHHKSLPLASFSWPCLCAISGRGCRFHPRSLPHPLSPPFLTVPTSPSPSPVPTSATSRTADLFFFKKNWLGSTTNVSVLVQINLNISVRPEGGKKKNPACSSPQITHRDVLAENNCVCAFVRDGIRTGPFGRKRLLVCGSHTRYSPRSHVLSFHRSALSCHTPPPDSSLQSTA